MMRLLNILVLGVLVFAAADVYKIKLDTARQARRMAQLRTEIGREQDALSALRAQWAKLDTPARLQELAKSYLALRPAEARQYDRLESLPQRPSDLVPSEERDPIGIVIAHPEILGEPLTGTTSPPPRR